MENTPAAIDMFISVGIDDFTPKRIVCLAQHLRQLYQTRKEISVLIFSTQDAAKHFNLVSGDPSSWEIFNHKFKLHAAYFYNEDKREEYVLLMPDALHSEADSPLVTRIDLPTQAVPDCRLQINHRCLIAFEDSRRLLRYPDDALRSKQSGTVVLTAKINLAGEVKDVQQAAADAGSAGTSPLLAASALQNLKTWRFEPGKTEESIQLAYSYEIENASSNGKLHLDFDLPTKVTIRAKPIR